MSEQSRTCAQCNAELSSDSLSSLCSQCLLKIGFETQPGVASAEHQSSAAYQPTFLVPTVQELSPHFPQLEILEILGHGGMGVVYKARQIELDRLVALKILRPNISQNAGFTERFLREARALAKLNHPNIITVYDFGRRDALYFFIMEFVDGTNLRHVERAGQLSPAEALNIVPQICSALQYAHDNGVVHRDIKPENILLTKSGDVRIADFGLAKLAGTEDHAPLTGTWQVMGTPHYMAPEQFEKPTTVDHRADIYSLGVVIYELLTGELPIGRFRLPSEKVRVDVRLDEVVLRSLDKEPDRRYQRVTDVATAVEAASSGNLSRSAHIQNARQWAQKTATSVGERARTLFGRSAGWEGYFRSVARWLSDRRSGIGTALMWVGGFEALQAFAECFLIPQAHPHSFESAILAGVAGCLAFWFGRQLRRDALSKQLRWAGLCCLLPLFSSAILPGLGRIGLMALGLIASLRQRTQNADDVAQPDIVDRIVTGFRTAQSMTNRRILLLTVFGIGGWCLVAALTIGGFYSLWYFNNVPSVYVVDDTTAQGFRLTSDESVRLSIRSSQSTESHGMSLDALEHERHSLELRGQSTHGQALLEFDFLTHEARMPYGTEVEKSLINREVVQHWMSLLVNDVQSQENQKRIDNLHDVVRLMMSTRGLMNRLDHSEEEYLTLRQPLTRLIRDPQMVSGLIPVGRLLDSELFHLSKSNGGGLTQRISPNDSSIVLFLLAATVIWLMGLLRVLRVLYRHLWRTAPTCAMDSATLAAVRRKWQWCSAALMINGLLSLTVMIMVFSATALLNSNRLQEKILHQLSVRMSPMFFDGATFVLVMISFGIAFCALLARPAFRRTGRSAGLLSAAAAILTLPLNLITYPAGLAALILLTDESASRLFQSHAETGNSTVTQPA